MAKAQVTSKGQVTVPKEIRDHLLIKAGDRIEFVINSDGVVTIRPCKYDIEDIRGALHKKFKGTVSVEDMEAAIKSRRSK
ncbi:MAG: AbrB/MazE/SpoVT family DNA-binding domain-containing protein [Oligoflexales bacterium]|nr:AbrB/MazE/SpoVT family DNA-binding domain-containing protein [Oligoflexales bacterium]